MKKHSVLKLLCITVFVAVLLTWILPVTSYSTTNGLSEIDRSQVGIFDVLSYATITLSYFGYMAIYILAIGGFYGVLNKTDGYRNLLDRIISKFKGKEWILVITMTCFIALITAVSGVSLAILFIFPFVISLMLMMGYERVTAALVTVGSVAVGIMGSIFSTNNTEEVISLLSLNSKYELLTRIMIFVTALLILIFFIVDRCKKYKLKKKDTDNILVPVESKDKKVRIWPIILIMDLIIVILGLSMVSWSTYGINIFTDALTNIQKIEIFKFPLFAKLLGGVNAFGEWGLTDGFVLILVFTAILGLSYKIKFRDFMDGLVFGFKKAFPMAAISCLVFTVLITLTYHPVMLTIYKPILELTKNFNVGTMSLIALISSVATTDVYYAANSVLPYAMTIITDTSVYAVIGLIWQVMYGISVFFAPTGLILLVTLTYLDISYCSWIKAIWKMLLTIVILFSIILFVIAIV